MDDDDEEEGDDGNEDVSFVLSHSRKRLHETMVGFCRGLQRFFFFFFLFFPVCLHLEISFAANFCFCCGFYCRRYSERALCIYILITSEYNNNTH